MFRNLSFYMLIGLSLFSFSTMGVTMNTAKVEKVIDDSAITAKVKGKLIADERVSALKIDVTTKNSVVELSGTVDSDDALHAAMENAYFTAGVRDVDVTNLKIDPPSEHPVADSIITGKVKSIFLREKIFGEKPLKLIGIHVETKNGVVTLRGKANKQQSKNAENLAKHVKGVKEVINEIS